MDVCSTESTARCVKLLKHGGYDCVSVEERAVGEPGAQEVLVAIHACGQNFADIYVRQGVYSLRKPPFVMGMEGAGIVLKAGAKVKEFSEGDRVMCWSFHYGMWSTLVKIPASNCCPIPDGMTFTEATAIPINYATAYFALLDFGNLREGQRVLIQSVAGGVGCAATQLAHTVDDVTVFGTCSSNKFDFVKQNGVAYPIDYRELDFVQEVLKIESKGVDIVLDCLSGHDFTRSRKLLKHMGRLIHLGINNAVTGDDRNLLKLLQVWWSAKNVSVSSLVMDNQSICGLNLASLMENDPDRVKAVIKEIISLYDQKIKPKIDSIWTFDEVKSASQHMVRRKNVGKIVLIPAENFIEEKYRKLYVDRRQNVQTRNE